MRSAIGIRKFSLICFRLRLLIKSDVFDEPNWFNVDSLHRANSAFGDVTVLFFDCVKRKFLDTELRENSRPRKVFVPSRLKLECTATFSSD